MASTVRGGASILTAVQAVGQENDEVMLEQLGLTASEAREALQPVQLAAILKHALEVFGDQVRATRWLRTDKVRLDGRTPLEEARTKAGCRRLEELLVQMEEGMVI